MIWWLLLVAALLAPLLWWLLVTTEGVYLGRRVVIWLYDLYARRYDKIKAFVPEYEHILLAQPIMSRITPQQAPLVLDVATGTGRLPDALLDHVLFQGRIIGIDLSRKMLGTAAEKLASDRDQVALLWCPAEHLPFSDNAFDVVTCLESLEFMIDPVEVLRECVRVLRPGGLLLTTSRINTRWMPGKTLSDDEMRAMLESCGVEGVEFELWQEDYHRVWAVKRGESLPVGARSFEEVLRCPQCCGVGAFVNQGNGDLVCELCGARIKSSVDGVLEVFSLYGDNP